MTSYLEMVLLKLAKKSCLEVGAWNPEQDGGLFQPVGEVNARAASARRSQGWLQKWINPQVLSQLDKDLVCSQAQRCFRRRQCSEGDAILRKPRAREALW